MDDGGGLEIRRRLSRPVSSYLAGCLPVHTKVDRCVWMARPVPRRVMAYVANNVANFVGNLP